MGTVLVTGGAGFVASHLCTTLLSRGETPIVIDDLSNGYRDNVPEGVELVVADLANDEWIERLSLRGEQLTMCLTLAYLPELVREPTQYPHAAET